jgi:transposase-like protein
MPAKSKQQAKYIWVMRNKYKSKKKAPKNMKWVFNKDWTDDISFKDLPKKIKEKHIHDFISFVNENYLF